MTCASTSVSHRLGRQPHDLHPLAEDAPPSFVVVDQTGGVAAEVSRVADQLGRRVQPTW